MNILRPVLTLILIILILHIVESRNVKRRDEIFKFPDYRVEAFTPSGLRVSIPHIPGIILFAFHGNINNPLNNIDAGDLSMDIVKRTGSRWVYENRQVTLNEDDHLYFWLFVIKNDLGFKLEDQVYPIETLLEQPATWFTKKGQAEKPKPSVSYRPTPSTSTEKKGCTCQSTPTEEAPCSVIPQSTNTTTPSTIMTTPSQIDQIVSIWTGSLNNVTEEKIHLSAKVERLSAENQHLIKIIKQMNSTNLKKLIIGGKIPKGGDPEDFIRSLLREKLVVGDRFASGERNQDGTITLTMEEYAGKLNVLYVAQEKLKHSQILLIDAMLISEHMSASKIGDMYEDAISF